MKTVFAVAAAFLILAAGGVAVLKYGPAEDRGGDAQAAVPHFPAAAAQDDVFCQTPQQFRMAYDENMWLENRTINVTMKRYFKQTADAHYYRERLSTVPEGVGLWSVATKDSYIVYSNADGSCVRIDHSKNPLNPFLQAMPMFAKSELSGETKQFGNDVGHRLKQKRVMGEQIKTEMDYVNKDYCIPMVQEVDGGRGQYSEKVNFTRDFPDTVFEIPAECGEVR